MPYPLYCGGAHDTMEMDMMTWLGNQSRRRKTDLKPVKLHIKIDLVSYSAYVDWLVNTYPLYSKSTLRGVSPLYRKVQSVYSVLLTGQ